MSTQVTWAQRLVAAAVDDAAVVIRVSTGSAPADGTHWGAPHSPATEGARSHPAASSGKDEPSYTPVLRQRTIGMTHRGSTFSEANVGGVIGSPLWSARHRSALAT